MLTLNDIPAPGGVRRGRPVARVYPAIEPHAIGGIADFHYAGPAVDDLCGCGACAPHLWEEAVEV